jgi:hypothetical protein
MRLSRIYLLLVLSLASTARAAEKPIVAVFTIEDRTGKLSETTCQLLTEYLAVKIAEGGLFQVVPSRQIKDRLTELKKESYKECYDEKCQIEIGKELAASKSLSTRIVPIGGSCTVMGTLYDLRRAASEASASQQTPCAQDDLVKALEKLATALKQPALRREALASAGPQGELVLAGIPRGARVTVDGVFRGQAPLRERLLLGARDHDVRVELPGHEPWQKLVWVEDRKVATEAVVLRRIVKVVIDSGREAARLTLDGQQRGTTPITLELVEGREYALSLEREDRAPIEERVTIRAPYRLDYRLEPTRRARRSRLEPATVELTTGGSFGSHGRFLGGGLGFAPLTLRWPRVCWTILEGGIGTGPGEKGGFGYTYLDTRVSVPLYFGRRDEHQLHAGLGFGWGAVFLGKMFYSSEGNALGSGADPLHLTLTAHYRYQTSGRFFVGAGVRTILPVTSSLQTELPVSTPVVMLFSLILGGALLP